MKNRLIIVSAILLLISSCKPEPPEIDLNLKEITLEVPDHFRTPEIPEDNPLTPAKITLGKRLFFDPILSLDSTVSCGSCHLQEKSFADPVGFSEGINGQKTGRNSMALINLVYAQALFWDGANPTLETQVLVPIMNPIEMNMTPQEVIRRLQNHPEYPDLFQYVFNDTINMKGVTDAIASYERILISSNSKYDRFIESGMDSTVFTDSEWRGYNLYFAERSNARHAECFHCHGGFNFDDPADIFRNNGLYEFYADKGRGSVTLNPRDVGKFKVPTLRNIEFTAPYMHDGSLATLEEVLDHYASGGQPHQNLDPLIQNIVLTEQDKKDVIAFLKTLSDPDFINNPAFRPE